LTFFFLFTSIGLLVGLKCSKTISSPTDWNEEFQRLRDRELDPDNSNQIDRISALRQLSEEFAATATRIGFATHFAVCKVVLTAFSFSFQVSDYFGTVFARSPKDVSSQDFLCWWHCWRREVFGGRHFLQGLALFVCCC
jgi:hypothetical protein